MSTTGNGTIGERIKECRNSLGMSQEELAEILYMKKSSVSKYENDNHDISASAIIALSKSLDTTPNYLLLGHEETRSEDAWIEDMIQVMKKITEPLYRELALKQLKCIAGIAA